MPSDEDYAGFATCRFSATLKKISSYLEDVVSDKKH